MLLLRVHATSALATPQLYRALAAAPLLVTLRWHLRCMQAIRSFCARTVCSAGNVERTAQLQPCECLSAAQPDQNMRIPGAPNEFILLLRSSVSSSFSRFSVLPALLRVDHVCSVRDCTGVMRAAP
jgi:hypothetical protein